MSNCRSAPNALNQTRRLRRKDHGAIFKFVWLAQIWQITLSTVRRRPRQGLSKIVAEQYDVVFYPGRHGSPWDLAENRDSIALIESMYASGKPQAAVCRVRAAFQHTHTIDGLDLVHGKAAMGFTNSEETASGLTHAALFLVEDMLNKDGAKFSKAPNWQSHVVTDGNLITGHNPALSDGAATAL